jgi:calcineurin-like phosphoesterase family protein
MKQHWFTADHHFGHREAIPCFKRPFSSVDEMNKIFIDKWNQTVQPGDIVYYLGDFWFGSWPGLFRWKLKRTFDALNGQKILIVGNHDREGTVALPWMDIAKTAKITIQGQSIHLSHHAVRLRKQDKGVWYLHGHTHGRQCVGIDVGVDCWDFRPIALTEIRERLDLLRKTRDSPVT